VSRRSDDRFADNIHKSMDSIQELIEKLISDNCNGNLFLCLAVSEKIALLLFNLKYTPTKVCKINN